jgi:spoIIIJ-associated protein
MSAEVIKEFFANLLSLGGFPLEQVSAREDASGTLMLDAIVADAGILIGEGGVHLTSWEHVLKAKAAKELGKHIPIVVDINNYRAQRDSVLREVAKKAARKAVLAKKPVPLPAMNAYERKIVHLELAYRPDVTTESEGEEPERRVVVKPISF